jgi:hypothetical protein
VLGPSTRRRSSKSRRNVDAPWPPVVGTVEERKSTAADTRGSDIATG